MVDDMLVLVHNSGRVGLRVAAPAESLDLYTLGSAVVPGVRTSVVGDTGVRHLIWAAL